VPADYDAAYAVISRLYFLFAIGVSLGALQVAASVGGLRGLWYLPTAGATRLLGICAIAATIVLFFLAPIFIEGPWAAGSVDADSSTRQWGRASWQELAGAYNVNDIDGGMSGTAQAIWFPAGFAAALGLTLAGGTLLGWARRLNGQPQRPEDSDGLAALESGTFPDAVRKSWRAFRTNWRAEVKEEFRPGKYRWSIFRLMQPARSQGGPGGSQTPPSS